MASERKRKMAALRSRWCWLPIEDIWPYDDFHQRIDGEPGFLAWDKKRPDDTQAHIEGAQIVREHVGRPNVYIYPIPVCPMLLAPKHLREPGYNWFRCDGFKRWLGQKWAGCTEVLCEVLDDYQQGAQKGGPLLATEEQMGKVLIQLASGMQEAAKLPFAERISIEDCETIHVHLGNLRLEYTRTQFLQLADEMTSAAATLRARRGL